MTLHRNARTCPSSRRLIAHRVIDEGWTLTAAAEAAGVSVPTARKWVRRYREAGESGLEDRSSAPRRVANRTAPERIEAIRSLRALRFTGEEIAELLAMAPSTVSLVLKREGLGRLPRPNAAGPERRYERARAGELVHVDVKKLGRIDGVGHRISGRYRGHHRARGAGWDYVHVCVDDATRIAYAEVLSDERPETSVAFLRRALGYLASLGIEVERVMTDNGNPYRSKTHAIACRELALKHLRTEPYRPRTNGKAERFIQTLTRGWSEGAVYATSRERIAALPGWLDRYNRKRPHRSLGRIPPMTRLAQLNVNNVAGAHS
jgi:transposase InsO family protein